MRRPIALLLALACAGCAPNQPKADPPPEVIELSLDDALKTTHHEWVGKQVRVAGLKVVKISQYREHLTTMLAVGKDSKGGPVHVEATSDKPDWDKKVRALHGRFTLEGEWMARSPNLVNKADTLFLTNPRITVESPTYVY